ncbi:hypothetical protein BT96DRAFT_930239 [Gymnopus androsaceus JB14]|uniref:Uncharacterized protein n=1 Tax=Gymnopus androsaceus JB14 TaxID=1447944 RepID=A0A6A4GAR5_9AGAR|nr:hypothetical protein BT96DRAFT_930239 [Gymnopus androsaceus JB14]
MVSIATSLNNTSAVLVGSRGERASLYLKQIFPQTLQRILNTSLIPGSSTSSHKYRAREFVMQYNNKGYAPQLHPTTYYPNRNILLKSRGVNGNKQIRVRR